MKIFKKMVEKSMFYVKILYYFVLFGVLAKR